MYTTTISCSTDEDFLEAVRITEANTELIVASLTSLAVQAENYDTQSGVQVVNSSKVGYVQNGDWIRFKDFDFSGASSVTVRAASARKGGNIEFRAGGPESDLLGEVSISNTGGWNAMQTFTGSISDDSNNSDLYLVFTGGSGYLFDVDSFTFSGSNASSESVNLALAGSANQSSNYSNSAGGAELAIDGDTNGTWKGGSVTHTLDRGELDWWQVRLGGDSTIEEVVVWNRTDSCCSSRLSNFDVFIYDNSGTLVFKETFTEAPSPSLTISTGGVIGNRVRIKQKDSAIPLSLSEVQIYGDSSVTSPPNEEEEQDDEEEENEGGSIVTPGNANVPSDLMPNCNQWKITYPDGEEDKTLCGEANNEYFYVNNDRNGLVFRAPIRSNNVTTPNSSYIRSELRERTEDGGSDIYWTTDGIHVVYVSQAITHLPIVKNHLVATQIHGNKDAGIDDSMVLRLEGSHLFLSFNGGKLRNDFTIKTNYTLGTYHEVVFEVIDGKHYVYYSEDGNLKSAFANGNASQYLVKDGNNDYVMDLSYGEAYFKIGNYTQSNSDEEGSETDTINNYGEVVVYDLYATHE